LLALRQPRLTARSLKRKLGEVERYTKALDRERLARSAMARMAVAQDMDRGSQENG